MTSRSRLRFGQKVRVERQAVYEGEIIEIQDRYCRVKVSNIESIIFQSHDDNMETPEMTVTTTFTVLAEPPLPDGWYLVDYCPPDGDVKEEHVLHHWRGNWGLTHLDPEYIRNPRRMVEEKT